MANLQQTVTDCLIHQEPYDYRDLENVVFIQDFPERQHAVTHEEELPEFARDLCDLLDKMHVPPSVKQELFKYDFSRAKVMEPSLDSSVAQQPTTVL